MQQHYGYQSDFRMMVLYFVDRPTDLYYTYQNPQVTYAAVKDFLDSEAITDEMLLVRTLVFLLVIFMVPLIVVVFIFFHQQK